MLCYIALDRFEINRLITSDSELNTILMSDKKWKTLSIDLKNLIKQLLCVDPWKRMSLRYIYQNNWFNSLVTTKLI